MYFLCPSMKGHEGRPWSKILINRILKRNNKLRLSLLCIPRGLVPRCYYFLLNGIDVAVVLD